MAANSAKKKSPETGPFVFANSDDIKESIDSLAGLTLLSLVPRRREARVFNWMLNKYLARQERKQDFLDSAYAARIRATLGDDLSEAKIREIVRNFYVNKQEDRWGRWQAIRSRLWPVTTEVEGIEHLHAAQRNGRGAILWGISTCGTLFAKIALANAGVELAQLSSYWHGLTDPNTFLARKVVGPLYCRAENQYLRERIVIPADGDKAYLQRIGEVLAEKGCIWMAGEGNAKHRAAEVRMFGRTAKFPVGAPMLATRYNAALIPAYAQRTGPFSYKLIMHAPITPDPEVRRNKRIKAAVQAYADIVEAVVREQPGDWDWEMLPGTLGSAELPTA